MFAEFVFLGQQLQTRPLDPQRRIEDHAAVAHKDRSRDFALRRRNKTNRAGVQVKGCRVALEREIVDRYGLTAQRNVAQLLVSEIGVGSRAGILHRNCPAGDNDQAHQHCKMRASRTKLHGNPLGEGGRVDYE